MPKLGSTEERGKPPMMAKTILTDLLRNERGATAIEYGLICSLIVIAILGAMGSVATEFNTMWVNVTEKTSEATSKVND